MNKTKLLVEDRDRLQRIMRCDIQREKRIAIVLFVVSIGWLILYPIWAILIEGREVFIPLMLAFFTSLLMGMIGTMRFGYYKLFRIIQALNKEEA